VGVRLQRDQTNVTACRTFYSTTLATTLPSGRLLNTNGVVYGVVGAEGARLVPAARSVFNKRPST
jgi:hypothetical protein